MNAAVNKLLNALRNQGTMIEPDDFGYKAFCPCASHGLGEISPTLIIREAYGSARLHCLEGCGTREILEAIGLVAEDLTGGAP